MSNPPRATREAIANALCHRDYTTPGGAVAVAMYDDHLEITNPGSFHFGITPAKLIKPYESKPWNPIIANVFYRAGIIERWGSGTLNILDWCAENENPAPTWIVQAESVFVSFAPAKVKTTAAVTGGAGTKSGPSRDQVASHVTPQVTGEVPDKYPTSTRQVTPQVVAVLKAAMSPATRAELQQISGLRDREHFRAAFRGHLPEWTACVRVVGNDHPRQAQQQPAEIPPHRQRPPGSGGFAPHVARSALEFAVFLSELRSVERKRSDKFAAVGAGVGSVKDQAL